MESLEIIPSFPSKAFHILKKRLYKYKSIYVPNNPEIAKIDYAFYN